MSIPLHLITGFLGSGKTSFLMHYLNNFSKGRRIGVIQNEFSPVGIDGKIISQHEGTYKMLEINNGSVFCVCLLGSFIDSLSDFIEDNSLDEIIMETSGMSDPISIGQIFQFVKLRDKVYLGHSWAIVDAKNFDKLTVIRSRLEHQLRIADTILINKCDLVPDQVESVMISVRKINPFAYIERSSFCLINFTDQKNHFKYFREMKNMESSRSDLQSVVIKSGRVIKSEKLKKFINSVKSDFIRCKGYVNIDMDQKVAVQGTFDDYTINQIDWFPGPSELVGIGLYCEQKNYMELFENFCTS